MDSFTEGRGYGIQRAGEEIGKHRGAAWQADKGLINERMKIGQTFLIC